MMKKRRVLKPGRTRKRETGFTLIELLVSVALFLVLAGPILSSLANSQRTYRTSELRVSLEQKMRAALELMAQEVSQAGLQPSGVDTDGLGLPLTTVAASACTGTPATCISASPTADESVQVTSTAGIYVGEWLWVDAGTGPNCSTTGPCEQVVVDGVSAGPPATISAKFQYNHTTQTINGTTYPTPIYGLGQYPQGIVPPGTTTSGGSTSSQLELFGDVNGSGNSLLAIIYTCPGSFPGPFTRTVYDGTTGSQISSTSLIDNVTSCQFTYPNPLPTVPSGCGSMSGKSIITSVGVTVTAQSTMNDPTTKAPVTVTKSFLNIQPRNVISALYVACGTIANELQPNPGSLP
jgi:prepilin-type N-terminal cleavage/methylation domain-containing protein